MSLSVTQLVLGATKPTLIWTGHVHQPVIGGGPVISAEQNANHDQQILSKNCSSNAGKWARGPYYLPVLRLRYVHPRYAYVDVLLTPKLKMQTSIVYSTPWPVNCQIYAMMECSICEKFEVGMKTKRREETWHVGGRTLTEWLGLDWLKRFRGG